MSDHYFFTHKALGGSLRWHGALFKEKCTKQILIGANHRHRASETEWITTGGERVTQPPRNKAPQLCQKGVISDGIYGSLMGVEFLGSVYKNLGGE